MPKPLLISTAVAGKVLLGVDVASTISVDVGRCHPGGVERRCARLPRRRRSGGFVRGCDVALANARALGNPLIGCFDDTFEVAVLHDAAGKGGARAADYTT